MRQITYYRKRSFVPPATHLVERKRKNYGRRKQEYERKQVYGKSVAEKMKKFAFEKIKKIVKKNERAARKTERKAVIVKSHSYPGDRPIAKYPEPYYDGNHHQIHVFIIVKIPFQVNFRLLLFRFRYSRVLKRMHLLLLWISHLYFIAPTHFIIVFFLSFFLDFFSFTAEKLIAFFMYVTIDIGCYHDEVKT